MQNGRTPTQLLCAAQIIMGVLAVAALPFFVGAWQAPGWNFVVWTIVGTVGYMLGQWTWFKAIKLVEGSRLASLYCLKIPVVGVLCAWVLDLQFSWSMIIGVGLAVVAAMLMNYRKGGGFSWAGMPFLALAIVCFASSDIGVSGMLQLLSAHGEGRCYAVGMVACICNIISGSVVAPFAKKLKCNWPVIVAAIPYALCYLFTLITIYVCFSVMEPVYVNVIVSTRGIFSLVLGVLVAKLGYTAVETKLSRKEWIQRGVAALIMFSAIIIYSYSKFQEV